MSGIAFNEDCDHYFHARAGQRLNAAMLASWVDQYAGTQIKELILNPNAKRTSYPSKVWEPMWIGYDPNGPDDQPLFKSLSPEDQKMYRKMVHVAWQMNQDGIDHYRIWIDRARKKKLSPWLSMRMNDAHCTDDEQNLLHSGFWRKNPQLHRVSYRYKEFEDRAFDYGREEVRAYYMKLVKEFIERYDFDGLELDWMRWRRYFRPGFEAEGIPILTAFMSRVRRLLDDAEQKRGHKIKMGARVASRPATALGLGMDAVTWARKGLIDMLVVTPFWSSTETDMPIEVWKQLLDGTNVTLGAGLELNIRPYPAGHCETVSLEIARGMAMSFLDRGADRIYLFNYFDAPPDNYWDADAAVHPRNYPTLLREIGSIEKMAGKPRRHVIAYTDTWAPGEPPVWEKDNSRAAVLPASAGKNEWMEFLINIGPKPRSGKVMAILGIEADTKITKKTLEVRVNGDICKPIGPVNLPVPAPQVPACGFEIPLSTVKRGNNLIEISPQTKVTVDWVEIRITP
jgi:hypothetical protein